MNTVRCCALEASLKYGLWVMKNLEQTQNCDTRLRRGFDEIPELREVLEEHLDTSRDPSRAARSVYGQWFALARLVGSRVD